MMTVKKKLINHYKQAVSSLLRRRRRGPKQAIPHPRPLHSSCTLTVISSTHAFLKSLKITFIYSCSSSVNGSTLNFTLIYIKHIFFTRVNNVLQHANMRMSCMQTFNLAPTRPGNVNCSLRGDRSVGNHTTASGSRK